MKELRPSSFEEFITWYLEREARKKGEPTPIFETFEAKYKEFLKHHHGKLFPDPRKAETENWRIVELDTREEVETLICLANKWTREAGLLVNETKPNSRLLRTYVKRAKETDYFNPKNPNCHWRHLCYLQQFREQPFSLSGNNRVVIRTPIPDEFDNNRQGWYYLHDGIGRLLPYMYTVFFESNPFAPIEAFLAEEGNKV